ncbi:hypothetical protein J7T55_011362 [Diaporthe amygdali]|uniref:uncharacterized protein n=1 Tax=Phomopsis amygdali TaxID=1214568 RepID=UPI0022FF3DC5|nr:uncharacterized protein J7T55_011362 [Diaporthe amygdali]KAJ0122901.1 hypothetical protein J7T55_011362 [Diaporthe amygdali]
MSFLPGVQRFITNTLGITSDTNNGGGSSGPGGNPSSNSSTSGQNSNSSTSNTQDYEPSAIDVLVAKAMLTNGLNLPHEIVLAVLDHAEYWPHTTTTLDHSLIVPSGPGRENQFVLRSKPLGLIKKVHYDDHFYSFTTARAKPLSEGGDYSLSQFQEWIGGPTDTLEHPCRKIVFTMRSRDQGWGGGHEDRGSYRGSWTWFEAGKERFDKNATHPKDTPEKEALVEGDSKEAAGSSSPHGPQHEIPTPYFPVYAARSFQPALEPGQEAFHHDLHPSPELTIQRNKAATRQPTIHKVVWSWKDDTNPLSPEKLSELGRGPESGNGDFVRNLTLGDVVTVWAKARFAGWTNHIERVKVDIYWAL